MARGLAAAVLAVVALALAVLFWPQGDDGEGGGPLNAIAAAAAKTQSEPGMRGTMRAVVTSPNPDESITMTGRSVFDESKERSHTFMKVPVPQLGETVEMEMVSDGSMIYMRSGAFAGELPDGREWMGMDISFGGELDLPVPATNDAKGELELLEAATGDVRKLGREKVRGVPATHYTGTIAIERRVEQLREEGADDIASYLEKEGAPLRVDVWIDADGLVRRMRIVQKQPAEDSTGTVSMEMQMDFFDFGPVPAIEVPESDEVFDITSLTREQISDGA